jgi:serine/threonine protein kinase
MQYVPGESLQTRVDREGPLDVRQLLRIGIQAAAGLAAAHEQGVIHRDIKPANILLENQVERVLLTDFGLARTVDDASLTHTGIIAGTPHYMSPEQASGESCDHRTDLFSLGAVLYFMATGRPPFRAEKAIGVLHRICNDSYPSVWSINPDIPDEVCEVIDRLLEKKAHRRFASAAATRDALVGILERVQQPRRRWRQHLRRSLKRQSGRDWMLLAAGVFVLMLALLVPGRHRPQDDANDGADVVASGHASATSRQAVADEPPGDGIRPDEFQPDESTGQSADSFLSPVADNALQNAASEQAAGDRSFDRELADLQNQLQQSESVQRSEFLVPPRSDWDLRIEALRRELDEIDGSLNPNAVPSDLLPVNPPTFE